MSRALVFPLAVLTIASLAACGSTNAGSAAAGDAAQGATAVSVASTSDACVISAASVAAGPTSFTITNNGDAATEFYLYAADGQRIVGEVENIGPALTRDLTVVLETGTYVTACKPGMTGDGIRGTLTVTGTSTASAPDAAARTKAAADYKAWVATESARLLTGTTSFVAAVKAGDQVKAKSLYAATRAHWEAIEPIAESFGDLDPKLDARVNDVEAGEPWTGWHRLEKALWVDRSLAGMSVVADQMLTDTEDLVGRIAALDLTVDQVTNGAKELLDEVATGKVTGEEERYSHTDLVDFQANIDGARKAFEVVTPIVSVKDPALTTTLDAAFGDLQKSLDTYRSGTGFVLYTALTPAQVKELAAKVEALSEPLSRLTATVVA
jgi:iron uptake system component EfeO